MAAVKGDSEVSRLFSLLQRAAEEQDDEQALVLARKILETTPDDPDALHCQVVSLIHLSRFEPALQLVRATNKKRKGGLGKIFQLEEAYCLYRQEKYTETLSILATLPADATQVRELVAQVAYRQEEYGKAQQAYLQLLSVERDQQERVANFYAAAALGGADTVDLARPGLASSMEQCFNLACSHLASGRGQEALELLEKAESLHREGLEEEGLTEEEIAEEMAVIDVQKGYFYHMQGQLKEATSCYNAVLKLRPNDAALIAVACNNILVLNGDKDIFDSKKRVKVLASEGGARKLTRSQKLRILFNRCLFSLHTNQLDQCRELGAKLKSVQPNSDLTVLAEVCLLHREKKVSGAVQCLEEHLNTSKQSTHSQPPDVQLYAVLAQLLLNQGNLPSACETLRNIPSSAGLVGVASTLASLHVGMGEVVVAADILERTLEDWMERSEFATTDTTERSKVATFDLTGLVKQVARFELAHSCPEAAAGVLERMLRHHDDLELRALLISAFSQTNLQKAEEASRSLPAFQGPAHLDVEGLERMPFFRHSRKLAADRAEVKSTEVRKEKKKKKRKPRLPKNFDPTATPDPERWLPLRERSYYRRTRRKGGVPLASRGTQGTSAASANLMSLLDASKPAAAAKQAGEEVKDVTGQEAVASPKAKSQSSQANKKKQKKKKGGKW